MGREKQYAHLPEGIFPAALNLPPLPKARADSPALPSQQDVTVTIDYVYDPLYRLTEANYSTGDYYHYTYDAVGNRLTSSDQLAVTSYQYDDANRIASAGGVTYTFDANGNLLSDGVNTYTYDSANRLVSVNGTTTYQYNGLGDRITQTANGMSTNYTLDLNPSTSLRASTGLTQVLSDGTTDYLYGNGRIAQVNTSAEYFLGDALGSVRQMTDESEAITFTRGYDPYGVVTYTTGASQTEFGFTGEQYGDSTQLLYLRARHYSSADGRFTSRDTWSGDYNRPLSLNRWMYVGGNPVNFTDPTGHIKKGAEAREAELILEKLNDFYDVEIRKDWGYLNEFIHYPNMYIDLSNTLCNSYWTEGNWQSIDELRNVFEGVRATANGMGGPSKFRLAMKNQPVRITRLNLNGDITPHTFPMIGIIYGNYAINDSSYIKYTTIHEFGHVWDIRTGFRLSSEMSRVVGTHYCDPESLWGNNGQWPACYYDWTKGKEPPPGDLSGPDGPYAGKNAREDWAESFAVYIDPYFHPNYILRPIRKQYVQDKINSIH